MVAFSYMVDKIFNSYIMTTTILVIIGDYEMALAVLEEFDASQSQEFWVLTLENYCYDFPLRTYEKYGLFLVGVQSQKFSQHCMPKKVFTKEYIREKRIKRKCKKKKKKNRNVRSTEAWSVIWFSPYLTRNNDEQLVNEVKVIQGTYIRGYLMLRICEGNRFFLWEKCQICDCCRFKQMP